MGQARRRLPSLVVIRTALATRVPAGLPDRYLGQPEVGSAKSLAYSSLAHAAGSRKIGLPVFESKTTSKYAERIRS